MAEIRDIFIVKIYYEDDCNKWKHRPIVIVNKIQNNDLYVISEITSQSPKKPPSFYDQFKEPIVKWKKSGLNKMSFVKTNKIYKVSGDKLYKKIGVMDTDDYIRIVKRIIEVNN